MWGVLPVYFKLTDTVPALEILAHRVVWAVPFGALIILFRRQLREVLAALRNPAMLGWLTLAAVCIGANWLIYIWAVQNDKIHEASLGYYMNPLVYVLVGVWAFGERLRRPQLLAVAVASAGVLILTLSGGEFPWVSLSLALLFTVYGVIRKQVAIGAMPGLFVETLILLPIALAWLAYVWHAGGLVFAAGDTNMDLMLLLAGPFTVLPLLFFAIAARKLTLTTVGFMQFIAPTLQFLVGLYYGERLNTAQLLCFCFIWLAIVIFSLDAVLSAKKKPLPVVPTGA